MKKPVTKKIACLMVPDFSIEVCRRSNPQLWDHPLALAESELETAKIIAVNREATDLGVTLNMTVAQGNIVCPALIIKVREVEKEINHSNAVYKKLQAISPFVEEAAPGLFYLDISGLGLLYKNDRQLTKKIITAAKDCGYPAKTGVAKNKFVAHVASDMALVNHFTMVSPGEEKAFLHPLSIEHIRLPSEISDKLSDLGLTTIGQLAAFPINEMIRRFGLQGGALSQLARGEDVDFFDPDLPDESLSQTVWLTDPLYQLSALVSQVEELLAPLLDRLKRFSQGCSRVQLLFYLDDKTRQISTIAVDQPTLNVQTFTRQLRLNLGQASVKLSAPVIGLTLTIPTVDNVNGEQLLLINGGDNTIPLNNQLDDKTITKPVAEDFFLPEQRFSFSSDIVPHRADIAVGPCLPYAISTVTGLRLFQPPFEIKVMTQGAQLREVSTSRSRQTITICHGPWELSGGWWDRSFDRLYYEIQIANRQSYLIFFDRAAANWFLQGVFD